MCKDHTETKFLRKIYFYAYEKATDNIDAFVGNGSSFEHYPYKKGSL